MPETPTDLDDVQHDLTAAEPPLCVDLDGTLVKSDTLVDAVLLLLRQQPYSPLKWFGWLRGGRAGFKREVTDRAVIEVEHLPYNQPLLAYLQEERARGRTIYLATAADQAFAEQVAAHIGLFDGVLASDGTNNLAGTNKLRVFKARFPQGFTYIGNAVPDRTLLQASHLPMAANPTELCVRRFDAMARRCTANSAIESRLQKFC